MHCKITHVKPNPVLRSQLLWCYFIALSFFGYFSPSIALTSWEDDRTDVTELEYDIIATDEQERHVQTQAGGSF